VGRRPERHARRRHDDADRLGRARLGRRASGRPGLRGRLIRARVAMPFGVRLLFAWAVNALALWVANGLISGVDIHGTWAYVIGAAVLGIANTIVKPILAILTLPLIVFTLGFFYLLI